MNKRIKTEELKRNKYKNSGEKNIDDIIDETNNEETNNLIDYKETHETKTLPDEEIYSENKNSVDNFFTNFNVKKKLMWIRFKENKINSKVNKLENINQKYEEEKRKVEEKYIKLSQKELGKIKIIKKEWLNLKEIIDKEGQPIRKLKEPLLLLRHNGRILIYEDVQPGFLNTPGKKGYVFIDTRKKQFMEIGNYDYMVYTGSSKNIFLDDVDIEMDSETMKALIIYTQSQNEKRQLLNEENSDIPWLKILMWIGIIGIGGFILFKFLLPFVGIDLFPAKEIVQQTIDQNIVANGNITNNPVNPLIGVGLIKLK
ncbi:MAG TPA: hypothetical protein PK993_04005 [Clostridia bacterium]|nr:hypothetical protein [Clostridia bacterium]